jgi:aminoglycoside 6'-N-acetyltransferase I
MNTEVRKLTAADLEVLLRVADDVFDNPVEPALAREFLNDPRHHIVVAIAEGVVVGFVSAVHYVHPDKDPQLWINEVSVTPRRRRQGLAKQMMQRMFDVGRALRCREAWVLTDRLNVAAMRLYAAAGGREGADEGPSDATLGYTFAL